ncbi:transcription initiation factor TFIID subunit 12 [Populus alba x Populus x berolinensis]|nr:transcription initiation factor TFIID subunit 12 [Populus alba x Populus x berolinensis]
MDRPAPTTSTSTSTPPITKQATEPPPSQPLPQPQPSSSTASPNPNLNPNPPPKPSISAATTITTTPSSTRPQTVHRPWQHPHPHSQFPSVSSGPPIPSSSSTTPSISSPRGVALGVPAPSPASFSSSFGHQFVGLNRAPVNVPESVANTSNSQARQGVMASMASNSQMRPHQQRPVQSSLRPPASSPNPQNFPGHVFIRSTPVGTAGSPVPNTSQSLQSPNQLWLSSASQGKPPLPSPSYRPQMNSPSLQQRSHIPPQHHSPPTTSQQQHMSPAQPQQPLQSHQQPEHYGQQFPPSRVQQSLSPLQQVSRVQGSVNHKPSSLAMSHPNTVQPLPQNSIANAESDESGNRILSKRSIHELVSQIDPSEKFNPEVVEILADIADEFLVSVTTFGCSLAKHRKSDTLEAKDILLHLDRNWNMTLPGFCGDEIKSYRKQVTNDIHKERLAVVSFAPKSSHPIGMHVLKYTYDSIHVYMCIKKSVLASEMANAKNSVGQAAGNAKSSTAKTLSNPIVSPNLKVT